jgi:hypothetical protein
MADKSGDTFTSDELDFMRNGELFDRKEEITKRVQSMLWDLQTTLKSRIRPEEFAAPEATDFIRGQVVRGERFHQRPYAYLDYPKHFSREAIFTFRSFFWWGSDFVFALILSGPDLDFYKGNLIRHFDRVANGGFYLSVAPNPWEWRRSSPQTVSLSGLTSAQLNHLVADLDYLKVQHFIEFDDPVWREGGLTNKGVKIFEQLKFIVANSPEDASRDRTPAAVMS